MKTLLVLSPQPELADVIRSGLNPEQYRIVYHATLEEAEPLLAHGLASLCVLDVELTGVQGIWIVEKIRRRHPKVPLIIFTGAKQTEWEEEAYMHGVSHVLTKPVRPRLLATLLDRLFGAPGAKPDAAASPVSAAPAPLPPPAVAPSFDTSTQGASSHMQPLAVLRDFSSILTHSLDADAMLKQFLLLLREILSINRAAIFVRLPYTDIEVEANPAEGRRLRPACAIGLSPGLLEHFEMSFDSGIAGQLFKLGRILRRHSDESRADVETQKEFELLGAQVAVPMLDRETLIGVAVFDGRVTGEPLLNSELQLIFHLLDRN